MTGQDAIRGFEYQFLRTLEYALEALLVSGTELAAVEVEGSLRANLHADQEIVDFAIAAHDRVLAVAQVKSGRPGTEMTASHLLGILPRLLEHSAERYLVVTNRSLAPGVQSLLEVIREGGPDLRAKVIAYGGRSQAAAKLSSAGDEFWLRLSRFELAVDTREIEIVRADVQELVRTARHRCAPETIGWDAAGLLTGYLVWEIIARAAGPATPEITTSDFKAALRLDADQLKSLMRERDWAVHVTPAPRLTDVARPQLLTQIEQHLPFPVSPGHAPLCVLAGLSGIGKSSIAAAWADEHAYAYSMIMWVDATSYSQISLSFMAIARWLQANGWISDVDEGAPARTRVLTALGRSARPWLMVFDNCPDLSLLREWIPRSGHGHTLVTSTDQTPIGGAFAAKVRVHGMSEEEATRLLAARVFEGRTPEAAELEPLRHLATRLHCWPLAVELAAGYLRTTELETAGVSQAVAGFEELLDRAMNDRPSVPPEYPNTVVGAITLAWSRLAARDGDAEIMAANALRAAAFVASRQIPLHLVLAGASNEVAMPFPHYGLSTPPAGEVLRAVTRDSLVTTDAPFPVPQHLVPTSVRLPNAAITMNDIVQRVVRKVVDDEGLLGEVLFRVVFCTQAWLQSFSANYDLNEAVDLIAHAIELSEHAIELGEHGQAAALLWGNTAGILGHLESWEAVVRYSVVELTALDLLPEDEVVHLKAQSLVALARALHELADHPRDAVDVVVPHLEAFIGVIPASFEKHEEATAASIRAAHSLARSFRLHGVVHDRLNAIEAALDAYRRMIPQTEGTDWYDELFRLNGLVRNGHDTAAITKSEALLASMKPAQPERFQVLRVLAETYISKRNWELARALLLDFAEHVRAGHVGRFDVATLTRNAGLACMWAISDRDQAAVDLLDLVVQIAQNADDRQIVVQAGDRDVIFVLRALHSYLMLDKEGCADWLKKADLKNIDSVEQTGTVLIVHRLLDSWISLKPESAPGSAPKYVPPTQVVDHTFKTPRHPVPDTVFPLDIDHISSMLMSLGPETAVPRAIASAQVMQMSGKLPSDPLEVAIETCLAARILGLQADMAETMLQVLFDHPELAITDPEKLSIDNVDHAFSVRTPHLVARLADTEYITDAIIPQLLSIRSIATTNPLHRHPVVVPLPTAHHAPTLRRDGLVIAHTVVGIYSVSDVAATLPPDRLRKCETNAIFIAFRALLLISVTQEDLIHQIERMHPQLAGMTVRLDQVVSAMEEFNGS